METMGSMETTSLDFDTFSIFPEGQKVHFQRVEFVVKSEEKKEEFLWIGNRQLWL